MQTSLTYRTNRDLFSNHYLDKHLPETEAWEEVDDEELEAAREEILDLYDRERDTAPERTEASLEEKFIRPIFRKLCIPFEVEETVSRGQRRPDYGFFKTEDAARNAFDRREETGDFYENAIAVADAKRWGRPLDTRGSGEHRRDFENPSYQIHVYLQETPTRWAVLTDGKKWRLYYGPTSHRLDSYYEVDLPTILEQGDLEDFKYFYLFFGHEAFVEDATGDCFLDDVYEESNVFAEELGEDLQENIYEAIRVLSEGFLQYSGNDLDESDLGLVHDSSLIYLYRIIFVLYAEAEGRDLLDTDNPIYEENYSLNTLKQEVAEELDSDSPTYKDWQTNIGDRLDELFQLIDQGSKQQGIPEEDLYIPAYNGGLFRTDPGEDGSREARFLANHEVGDAHLTRVIELLTRSANAGNETGEGKIFVDYSSLDVRHLGSVYEGLLEYQLNVAEKDLAVEGEDGEYVPVEEGEDVVVEAGDIYLTTDSGERKATGSYYTPEYVVEYIVENTLGPLVENIRKDLVGQSAYGEGGFAGEFADRVFELKVLDPAMGSGHFLTSAVDYLAREIIDAQEKQAAQEGIETVNEERDINWARRQVAQRCIYGVDLNPLAVELAKVSLWLRTLAAEQPLAFLDHHLKTGNSLVGSDIETVLDNSDPDSGTDAGQLTLQETFDRTRQQALGQVTDQFEDLLAIDNETLSDIKEMEAVYEEVRKGPLYQHLVGMANVHTAEQFGLDVPGDAYKRMATALRDDSWESIEGQDWYRSAQQMAADEHFFHWELEFPIAFYEQDGERMEDVVFDAVIGNPPYIRSRNLPDSNKEYYKYQYESAEGSYDIYIPFLEQAGVLGRQNSFIIPNKWTTTNYGEQIRNILLDRHNLTELVDVSRLDVFPDADIYPVITNYSTQEGKQADSLVIRTVERSGEIAAAPGIEVSEDVINQLGGRVIPVNLTPEFDTIVRKLLSQETIVGDYVEMTEAIHTGNVRDKLVVEEEVDESCEKLTDGKNIERYHAKWSGKWIRYDENLISTEDREYGNLQDRELFDCDEKLFVRDISYWPVAAYDDQQLFALNTLYSVKRREDSDISLKYILAIFNSSIVGVYFRKIYGGTHVSGDYLRFKPMFSYNIPIPSPTNCSVPDVVENKPDNVLDDIDRNSVSRCLAELTDVIRDAKATKSGLNLALRDYLQIPSGELPDSMGGDTLEDLQMPVAGVADTPLTSTAADHDGLRVEGVSFAADGGRLVMAVDISYKLDEDDPRETDPWDRLAESEFETYEAMAFVGLSDEMETLVREFVPVAIEEAGGFAGFRQSATKTISPLDRLKSLTLPDIEAVGDGLAQYTEVRERADELEEKIEKTDQLIDEIVYDLYGLTDEEIEIVEEAVQDD